LYTDPKEYAPEGTTPDKVYPNGMWMPPTGVQRGTIYTKLGAGVGDPQTPVLPSIEGIYRRPINESELPTIPAQPISYGDAQHFLKHMKGKLCPCKNSTFETHSHSPILYCVVNETGLVINIITANNILNAAIIVNVMIILFYLLSRVYR